MPANPLSDQAIAWLLTYLLHSTLLLSLAWLLSKPLGRWSVAAEAAVWKLALVGAFFTASLQLAAGWEPAAGRWGLHDLAPPVITEPAAPAVRFREAAPVAVAAPLLRPALDAPVVETRMPRPSLPALALGAWVLGSLLLLARYGASHLRLRRRLQNRPRVVGGTLLSRLHSMTAEAGLGESVQLSCSSRVPVPLALGLRRPEICVPPRALAGLTDEQQEGMLAHELAHLVRRDPFWLVVSHLLACVFFFQPLNWVARRRLREISEMLSDEWAVGRTGRPLSLAGCLAEVAAWSMAGRELPVPVMADRPSHLARRIRRLLDEGRSPESPARRLWLGVAMVGVLIAVVAAAPAISAARQEAPARAEIPAAQVTADVAPSSEDQETGERDVAEERVFQRQVGEEHDDEEDADWDIDIDPDIDLDIDPDIDLDIDPDIDFDFDFDFDAGEIADLALDSVTAALGAMDGSLEALSEMRTLSEEDQERLEQEVERVNREIERNLGPRMEQLSRELSEKLSRELPTAEMKRLQQEMEKLAEQMGPSAEEMARLHSHIDEELRKLRLDGELSHKERNEIAAEARRMAREMRPSEEQREAMQELRRQHRELAQKFRAEHREEIERATREAREATQQMREEIQREMEAVRQELRRSQEQRRLRMQEDRRDRERQREEIRKQREREEGEAKPPKQSLRIDAGWPHFLQADPLKVAETEPGC